MRINKLIFLAATLFLILFTTACGSGGGGSNQQQPASYNANTSSTPVEVNMKETDPSGLTYEGAKHLEVVVSVTEQNTNFLVNYTLDGATKTLQKGQTINFNLKADGSATNLQFNFRFSKPTGGKYEVVVSPVQEYPNNQRPRTFKQQGSIPVIIDYTFLPQ